MLRPFDAVVPYRLEMQAKLAVGDARTLYGFWGSRLFDVLVDELDQQRKACDPCEGIIVNLASVEYAKAVEPYARASALQGGVRYVTCLFGSMRNGKFAQRSTEAKAARGTFVRWCTENDIESPADFPRFDMGGYEFDRKLSSEDAFVFVH